MKKISAAGLSYTDLLEQWDGTGEAVFPTISRALLTPAPTGPLLLTDVDYPAMNWTKPWITELLAKHKVKIQMRTPGPHWAKTGKSNKFYVIEPLDSFSDVVAQTSGVRWCYTMDEEFFFEEQVRLRPAFCSMGAHVCSMGVPSWCHMEVH